MKLLVLVCAILALTQAEECANWKTWKNSFTNWKGLEKDDRIKIKDAFMAGCTGPQAPSDERRVLYRNLGDDTKTTTNKTVAAPAWNPYNTWNPSWNAWNPSWNSWNPTWNTAPVWNTPVTEVVAPRPWAAPVTEVVAPRTWAAPVTEVIAPRTWSAPVAEVVAPRAWNAPIVTEAWRGW